MEKQQQFLNLKDNKKLHKIGLGTYCLPNNDETVQLIVDAVLKLGYRHIDTANIYQNEEAVGKALKKIFESGIKRSEIFITTKLWISHKNRAESALRDSLKKLQLEFVDLYLIHWPHTQMKIGDKIVREKVPLYVLWKNLENCVKKGLVTNIGLSNFNCQIIVDLLTYCEIKPFCNQIEIHPYLNQKAFVDWLNSEGIIPVAYASLGNISRSQTNGKKILLENDLIQNLAKKYNKSCAQVLLNWSCCRNQLFLAKSRNLNRLKENIDVFTFMLEEKEVEEINGLDCGMRLFDPIEGKFDLYYPIFK